MAWIELTQITQVPFEAPLIVQTILFVQDLLHIDCTDHAPASRSKGQNRGAPNFSYCFTLVVNEEL
jgi:hypothetical protein